MYYLLYGLFYSFSLLPFWILYRISDFFVPDHLLHCGVIERHVVMNNLAIAFPDKSVAERKGLQKNSTVTLLIILLKR